MKKSVLAFGADPRDPRANFDALQAASREATESGPFTLVLEDVPDGSGYLLDMTAPYWASVRLINGMAVEGEGWGSRLQIVGDTLVPGRHLLSNREQVPVDIRLSGVCCDGRWRSITDGSAWVGPRNPMNVFARIVSKFSVSRQTGKGIVYEKCEVSNFPGLFASVANCETVYEYNTVDRISGGCFVNRYRCAGTVIRHNTATNVCDDAIAFNGSDDPSGDTPESGNTVGATTEHNVLSRFNPGPAWAGGSATGPVYCVRGGEGITSRFDKITRGPGEGVQLHAWLPVKDVDFHDLTVRNTAEAEFYVDEGCSGETRRLTVGANPTIVNLSPSTYRIRMEAK